MTSPVRVPLGSTSDPVAKPAEVWPPQNIGVITGNKTGNAPQTYPTLTQTDPDGKVVDARPTIRAREEAESTIDCTLDSVIAETVPGFALEYIAQELYGNSDLWYFIADSNKLRHPAEWNIADIVRVPPTTVRKNQLSSVEGSIV